MTAYQGLDGTRPYAGAGWYYAEYRPQISVEFAALLAERLGWTRAARVLDLGAGPGQLALRVVPFVAEVVAIEPEPDMVTEGERRARALPDGRVTFVTAGAEDLQALRSSLGRFRTALMGQSFHWMVERDRVLHDLSEMLDIAHGSIAFVKPWTVSAPEALETAEKMVHDILEHYLADVPAGPHPQGRHDPFEEILARSAFPQVETINRVYKAPRRPTVESLLGAEYSISHVLTRLGNRREAFEQEVRRELGRLEESGEVLVTLRDEALIGLR
jgi:SAM-dependent methyltransferase